LRHDAASWNTQREHNQLGQILWETTEGYAEVEADRRGSRRGDERDGGAGDGSSDEGVDDDADTGREEDNSGSIIDGDKDRREDDGDKPGKTRARDAATAARLGGGGRGDADGPAGARTVVARDGAFFGRRREQPGEAAAWHAGWAGT
jgi:hypothetical protein